MIRMLIPFCVNCFSLYYCIEIVYVRVVPRLDKSIITRRDDEEKKKKKTEKILLNNALYGFVARVFPLFTFYSDTNYKYYKYGFGMAAIVALLKRE